MHQLILSDIKFRSSSIVGVHTAGIHFGENIQRLVYHSVNSRNGVRKRCLGQFQPQGGGVQSNRHRPETLFATEVGGNPLCRVQSMASSMLLSTPSYLPALMYRRQFLLFLERHMLYLPTYQVPLQMKIAWTVEGELTAVLTTFAQEEVCVPEWDIKKR